MSGIRYSEEFRIGAVCQVTEQNRPVSEVALRLGISSCSLYAWVKRYSKPEEQRRREQSESEEIRRLRAEARRLTEERDILKRAVAYFAKGSG